MCFFHSLLTLNNNSYSPEAQAVFDRMPDALPLQLKIIVAEFIDYLVINNNYNGIIDFGFFGLNTESNGLTSFKGAANPINQSAVWSKYGVISTNGSSTYVNLGFIPNNNADFALNDCGIGAFIEKNNSQGATTNAILGCIEAGSNTRQLTITQTGSSGSTLIGRINVGNNNISYASDNIFDDKSFYAVERTASNASKLIKDNSDLATAVTVSVAKSQISVFLGGRNQDGALTTPINATFRYWLIFKPSLFNRSNFLTGINILISKINGLIFRVLTIGDSIARGTSDGVGSAESNTLYEWYGSSLINITDDVEEAATGSPYPSLASTLHTRTGKIVHLVNCGSGGSEFSPNGDINNWSDSGGTLYGSMITKANAYLATQEASIKFDFIRITLGINDARGTADLSTINTDAISLIERLQASFPDTKILINQLGKGSLGSRYNSVRATIDYIVSNYSDVFYGVDLNSYPNEAFYDGLHLNQNYNDLLGQEDADIMRQL